MIKDINIKKTPRSIINKKFINISLSKKNKSKLPIIKYKIPQLTKVNKSVTQNKKKTINIKKI